MMEFIPPGAAIALRRLTVLIVGQPGICKTSLGYSLNTLLLAFDRGTHRAVNRRAETAVPETWDDVVSLSRARLAGVDAVTIDTIERALAMLTVALCEESSKFGVAGTLTPRGGAERKRRFGAWLDQLRSWGKDVILLAHGKEERRPDRTVVRADIPGGTYDEVLRQADFVGYLHIVGRDRVLDFNPSDRWVGKNPAGWSAMKVPPIEQAGTFLGELVARGRATLSAQRDESALLASEVDAWRAEIATYTTAPQFNAALPRIKAIPLGVLQPQVKQLLWSRSKALGLRFDEQLAAFLPPAVAALDQQAGPVRSSRAATWQPSLHSVLTTSDGAR